MRRFVLAALVLAAALLGGRPAEAIPAFAHRYGVECGTCHTIVPRLTPFGERFRDAGFRWPGPVATRPAFPISVKANLAWSSAPSDPPLPKAIVDEVEALLMQPVGSHLDVRVEQYFIDGGVPGKLRDAYVRYDSDPRAAWRDGARPRFSLTAGQFTLPLPDDPETQRPTENHYAVYDQTLGANEFAFFDDRLGLDAALRFSGAELHLVAAVGHDPQSGLPRTGSDTMAVLRLGPPALALTGYAYQGARDLGPVRDAFRRRGLGLTSELGKARTSLVVQTGDDTSADGAGTPAHGSGGYLQEEWAFGPRLIGVARYDAASGNATFLRTTTFALAYRVVPRARLTLEDVVATSPATTHTLNAGLLIAW